LRSSLLQGEECGNGILYAACNLFQYIDKADDFLHHLSAARTFAAGCRTFGLFEAVPAHHSPDTTGVPSAMRFFPFRSTIIR
jgi:hypothetical protein